MIEEKEKLVFYKGFLMYEDTANRLKAGEMPKSISVCLEEKSTPEEFEKCSGKSDREHDDGMHSPRLRAM